MPGADPELLSGGWPPSPPVDPPLVNANKCCMYTKAVPGSCHFTICSILDVDLRGDKFISNKETNSLAHIHAY